VTECQIFGIDVQLGTLLWKRCVRMGKKCSSVNRLNIEVRADIIFVSAHVSKARRNHGAPTVKCFSLSMKGAVLQTLKFAPRELASLGATVLTQ